MKTPILGGAYAARSSNAAYNRMVNLYPEIVPQGGKEPAYLVRCPGLRLLATIGTGPIRGTHQFGGSAYVVSGSTLYKLNALYSATTIGTISGTGPVSMADNGTQLFVASNPDGYIYNSSTTAFAEITDADFPGAVAVGYLDGYFVFNEPSSQRVWVTSLYDGTAVDPLDYASAEGAPDYLETLIVDHREAWLFGTNSIEVWYNSGAAAFPLERVQGAFIEIGCSAAHSVARADNSIFWLGSDARGNGIVYRANGYNAVRVSDHNVERTIQGYSVVSDAIAYTYQQDGHTFYVLIFPTQHATWVYDISTGQWHERESYYAGMNIRHRSNCMMLFNSLIVVGDYDNGNLYALDHSVYDDNGNAQRWLRSWRATPTGQNNLKPMVHNSLQLDIESGVGILDGQGEDPEVLLRWSDDGGHTWSNYHSKKMGKMGEYHTPVIWRRLGSTRTGCDRIYEISGTDPVKIAIMGAELNG